MNYLLGLLLLVSTVSVDKTFAGDFVNPIQNTNNESISYSEIQDEALFNCPYAKMDVEKQQIIAKLIKIEKSFNPPPNMRGMLLAAACMESGYNPRAKGDRKFSKNKKKPMAVGILQQWPIFEKTYGIDRTNPESAAQGWMNHIVRQIPKIKRTCGYKTNNRIWLAAWVAAIRYKKSTGRCKEVPRHYRLLKKWHKNIKRDRQYKEKKYQFYCTDKEKCGC